MLRLIYRRDRDTASSTFALKQARPGRWVGAIPAALTENDRGMTMEFRIEVEDRDGRRLRADPPEPGQHRVRLTAGAVERAVAPYETWWFWTVVVGAAAVATTAIVVGTRGDPPGDLERFTFPP